MLLDFVQSWQGPTILSCLDLFGASQVLCKAYESEHLFAAAYDRVLQSYLGARRGGEILTCLGTDNAMQWFEQFLVVVIANGSWRLDMDKDMDMEMDMDAWWPYLRRCIR